MAAEAAARWHRSLYYTAHSVKCAMCWQTPHSGVAPAGEAASASSPETGQGTDESPFLSCRSWRCPLHAPTQYSAIDPPWAGGASNSFTVHHPAQGFGTGSTEPPSGIFPRTGPRQHPQQSLCSPRQPMSKSRHRFWLGGGPPPSG
jgi:hypothetical protein